MLRSHGSRVHLAVDPGPAPLKPSQWQGWREKWYLVRFRGRDYSVVSRPWRGLAVLSSSRAGTRDDERQYRCLFDERAEMERRKVSGGGSTPVAALPSESKVLAKCPMLSSFMTETAYSDGTARTPGYMWLTNRRTYLEQVLFDIDACARIVVTGRTFDEVFAAVELVLRDPELPWAHDQFLEDRQAGKKKGKKS